MAHAGLELARALAMSTYRSPEEFAARFRAPPRIDGGRLVFPVEEYLQARGRDYAARNRARSFHLPVRVHRPAPVDATRITVRTEVVAVREDQLVPLADMRALTARLPRRRDCMRFPRCMGHDAFLKEAEQLRAVFRLLYPGESP